LLTLFSRIPFACQVFKQVKNVLPKQAAFAAVGMLLGRVLRRLSDVLLSRTDIGAKESHALFELFSPFLALEHTLFSTAAPTPVSSFIDMDGRPIWFRFVRIIEILEMVSACSPEMRSFAY
jgi:hypothetical protein